MTYFLQDVASYLYQRNRGNFRDTVIIFPGRRARLFFNHFLSQLTDKPLWAPKYYTINDFVRQLSGLQLADPLSLLFRLYTIFKQIKIWSPIPPLFRQSVQGPRQEFL